MVWTKRFLFALLVLAGLYLFGDFRVNDVNVRDYLQKKVSLKQFSGLGEDISKALKPVYQSLKEGFKGETLPDQKLSGTPEKTEVLLDHLTESDQKKMQKLIEKNIFAEKKVENTKPESKPKQDSNPDPAKKQAAQSLE